MVGKGAIGMEFRIRAMCDSDGVPAMRIYADGIRGGMATFETVCPSYAAWDQDHLKPCRLVADVDLKVVGWAALAPFSNKRAYRGVAEISIYVDPAYQGKGIGEKLLRALMAEAEANGFWTLQSQIIAVNTASVRLHEKCGFRLVGRRVRIAQDRFGRWQDTVLMEWRMA